MAALDMLKEQSVSSASVSQHYQLFVYGFHVKGSYVHRSQRCTLQSVTYNNKTGELIIVDSRGIVGWMKNFITDHSRRITEFGSYEFNTIRMIIYCSLFNVYFALTKEYELRVLNLNFTLITNRNMEPAAAHYIALHDGRGEVVGISESCIRIWRYGEAMNAENPMLSSFGLHLKIEIKTPDHVHISRVEIDSEMDRMYCLVEKQVWTYGMDGRFLFCVDSVGIKTLTACVFASTFHFIVVGGIDGKVQVLTPTNAVVHTFDLHSRRITSLLIHPADSQLVITSSLDGSVKLISLNPMQELYSVLVLPAGICWMKLKGQSHIYCASLKQIEIIDLNSLCTILSQLPYCVKSLEMVKSGSRASKLVVVGEDNNIKIFSKATRKLLTTVMPPPLLSPSNHVISYALDSFGGLLYLLLDHCTVWVYTTRTDPACRVSTWRTDLLRPTDGRARSKAFRGENLKKKGYMCYCLCIADFKMIEETGIGGKNLIGGTRPLLCGMEDGAVAIVDSHKFGNEVRWVHVSTGPINRIMVDQATGYLLVISWGKSCYDLQFLDPRDFSKLLTFSLRTELSCVRYKEEVLGVGCSDGKLSILEPLKQATQDFLGLQKAHKGRVLSIDINKTGQFLCTSGEDGYLKLWDKENVLLCDFVMGHSLTTACFLNRKCDLVIGFQEHLYCISSNIFDKHSAIHEANYKDVDSDQDTVVFESPYLRFGSTGEISETVTMENYLVPYDHMNLEEIFLRDSFTNGAVIDPFEGKSVSDMSMMTYTSDTSFANTSVYGSTVGSQVDEEYHILFPRFGFSPTYSGCSDSEESVFQDQKEASDIVQPVQENLVPRQIEDLERKPVEKESTTKPALNFFENFARKLQNAKLDSTSLVNLRKRETKGLDLSVKTKSSDDKEEKRYGGRQIASKTTRLKKKKKRAKQVKKTDAKKVKDAKFKLSGKYDTSEKNTSADNTLSEQKGSASASPNIIPSTSSNANEIEPRFEDDNVQYGERIDQARCSNKPEFSQESDVPYLNKSQRTTEYDTTVSHDRESETLIQDVQDTDDEASSIEALKSSDVLKKVQNAESSEISLTLQSAKTDKKLIIEDRKAHFKEFRSVRSRKKRPVKSKSGDLTDSDVDSDSEYSTDFEKSDSTSNAVKGILSHESKQEIIEDFASNLVSATSAHKTVRFKRSLSLAKNEIMTEKVIPLSRFNKTERYGNTSNSAPLYIFSLARKRQIHDGDSRRSPCKSGIESKEFHSRTQNQETVDKSSRARRTTNVRLQEQDTSFIVSNTLRYGNENPVEKATEIGKKSSFHSRTSEDSRKVLSKDNLMKLCVAAFKRACIPRKSVFAPLETESLMIRESKEYDDFARSQGLSKPRTGFEGDMESHQKERKTSSLLTQTITDEVQILAPSETCSHDHVRDRKESSAASTSSYAYDEDKTRVNFDRFVTQTNVRSDFDDTLSSESRRGHRPIQLHAKEMDSHPEILSSKYQDHCVKEGLLLSEHVATLKRIQSAGLRKEFVRRKLLSFRRQQRQNSAYEKRNADKGQPRRCVSAHPSLTHRCPEMSSSREDSTPTAIYDYTSPVPLVVNSSCFKEPSLNRRLEAKLAGQPFRYGTNFDLAKKEEKTLVDFAKLVISDSPKPLIMAKQKRAASIPGKCRDFILVRKPQKQKNTNIFYPGRIHNKRFRSIAMEECNV